MFFRIKEDVIKGFLKTVEEEDLFPGKVEIFQKVGAFSSDALEEDFCKALNERNQDEDFVKRVTERLNSLKSLEEKLMSLIEVLKENGTETEKDLLFMREKVLKIVSKLSQKDFKIVIDYGIKMLCLKKEIKKGKVRIILLSEEIEQDEDLSDSVDKKSTALKIFEAIKANGIENDRGESISSLQNVKQNLQVEKKDFERALEYCKKNKCVRTYQGKTNIVVVLLKEELPEDIIPGIEELKESVIKIVKTSNEETEEGYMYMTETKVLELLKISATKLRKVVTYGLRFELLKFDVIKENKIVVYTQERRLSVNKLI